MIISEFYKSFKPEGLKEYVEHRNNRKFIIYFKENKLCELDTESEALEYLRENRYQPYHTTPLFMLQHNYLAVHISVIDASYSMYDQSLFPSLEYDHLDL